MKQNNIQLITFFLNLLTILKWSLFKCVFQWFLLIGVYFDANVFLSLFISLTVYIVGDLIFK